MKRKESDLQSACVRWFRYQYPKYKFRLFAIPNGGYRNAREAAKLKREGVLAGVSDLILAIPNKQFDALFIEMKVGSNNQTLNQKSFQKDIESDSNYKYVVLRTLEDFIDYVTAYIKDK